MKQKFFKDTELFRQTYLDNFQKGLSGINFPHGNLEFK